MYSVTHVKLVTLKINVILGIMFLFTMALYIYSIYIYICIFLQIYFFILVTCLTYPLKVYNRVLEGATTPLLYLVWVVKVRVGHTKVHTGRGE